MVERLSVKFPCRGRLPERPSFPDQVAVARRRSTVEKQAGLARFVKVPASDGKGHELNLWIVGDAGGFQVLRFSRLPADETRQGKFTPNRWTASSHGRGLSNSDNHGSAL